MADKQRFAASLRSLTPLAGWLANHMADLPVQEEWQFALDLAACEAATNIIRYALHEDDSRSFSAEFTATDEEVCLRFTDSGDAMPDGLIEAARATDFAEMSPLMESGRGLKLILLCVDTFDYAREADRNITTLIKKVEG
ncbi:MULTISPECIES: ATP-binding protein [unclassified Enterobacter]|jgi:serine/threonine-protein kinase RsbW|uniref:ATP-binding protein n=1 Tax=unclassified Enterobacter TaxID=2608935 RepID=UPI000934E711|nr:MULTISPECIES: ATP-binding protein [unclassified Enterobacter]